MCQEKHHSLSQWQHCLHYKWQISADYAKRDSQKKKKKLLQHKRQQNLLDFCSSHWLCPHNSCVTMPANHFGQSSVIVSQVHWALVLGKAVSLGLHNSVPKRWELVSAQSLIISSEDFVSSKSNCVSGAWEVLAVTPYPDDDYWMRRKTENWRTLCKVRFVTFSTFLSLQNVLSLSGFTSCMTLCTELGRTFWPSPPKMGVALMGLSTECVNVRERAFFKCTWYQHFGFLPNILLKRGLPLLTEAGVYCVKEQAVEAWLTKNSGLSYVNVRLPGLTLFRMEQKLWSSSAWFSWSLFKHSPVASREDCKLKFFNWTSPCVLSLHQKSAPLPVPHWFSPEPAKNNWLEIAKQ